MTEFRADHLYDLPGIAREGIGLSRGWWAMPGAIGVSLYLDLRHRAGGSISVWTSEADRRSILDGEPVAHATAVRLGQAPRRLGTD